MAPEFEHSWRSWRLPTAAAAALTCLVLPGCRTYTPVPLALDEALEAFHARASTWAGVEEWLEAPAGSKPLQFEPEDGLALEEGLLVALAFHARNRLARLDWQRASAGSDWAGRFYDPVLDAELLRVTENAPERWAWALGLGLRIPVGGRRSAEKAVARARLTEARSELLVTAWSVERDVRSAWLDWSLALAQKSVTEAFIDQLEPLQERAEKLAQGGELNPATAALFRLERSRQLGLLAGLAGRTRAAELRVKASIGLAPDAPVELRPELPRSALAIARSPGYPLSHPQVQALSASYQVAEENLRLAIAKQWSDLTLGPRVEDDAGQMRIGLLGAVPLPLWNGNGPAIVAAWSDRNEARLRATVAAEKLVGQWATWQAELEAAEAQRAALEDMLAPLMSEQLAQAREMLRLGQGSTLVILESMVRSNQLDLERLKVRAAIGKAANEMATLAGRRQAGNPAEEKL